MKLILDFDDVLFNTRKLKDVFFRVLESRNLIDMEEQYHFERANDRPFSLILFITRLCKKKGRGELEAEEMYGEIMDRCPEFIHEDVIELMKSVGRENCFLVTNGDEEFQKDKIARTGMEKYVAEVTIVPGTKKYAIERFCAKFGEETVIFVDDKESFFEDVDMAKCAKLKTVHYDKEGISKLKAVIEESR